VVLDEAYVEFADEPDYWLRRRASYENLIILRTFSKAWGMAGWRIGYAVAPQAVVQLFYRTKLPYNLSQPAQLAAEQTLAQAAVIKSYIAQIQSERTRLAQALMTHPLVAKVFPSEANFLLVRFRYAARQLYEALLRQGIVTRFRGNLPLCEETIRISVGTPAENETLIQTLCAISSLIATEPS
jgi:histidinol-phosphate aminotransferase